MAKADYAFTSQSVSVGTSTGGGNASGNRWGINFAPNSTTPVVAPTCTVTTPASSTSAAPVCFDISFSASVSGLTLDKIIVSGATKVTLTGSGANYLLQTNPTAGGLVTCQVPAGAACDSTNNGNAASNTAAATYTPSSSAVTITSPSGGATYSTNAPTLDIAGTAVDNAGVTSVAWSNNRGGSGSCTGTANWSASGITLCQGANIITITEVNASGTLNTTALSVNYINALPGDAWQGLAMVSLPVIPYETDPLKVVEFRQNCWFMFDTSAGSYVGYDNPESWFIPAAATPGRGYWASLSETAPAPYGTIPPQDQPVTIHLYSGWNMIGDPFITPVNWDTSTISVQQSGAAAKPMQNARDLVADYAWGWDCKAAVNYMVCDPSLVPGFAAQLQPWQGYWIKAIKDCDLILPPPTTASLSK